MKILLVTFDVPNCDQGTGPCFSYLMVNALSSAGHEVSVLAPRKEIANEPVTDKERERWIEDMHKMDISVDSLALPPLPLEPPCLRPFRNMQIRLKIFRKDYWWARIKEFLFPDVESLFPEAELCPKLARKIEEHQPDGVIIWADYGIALGLASILKLPRMIILGDPPSISIASRHLPPFVSFRHLLTRECWRWLWRARHMQRITTKKLCSEKSIFNTVHSYSVFLDFKGMNNIRFLRALVPDIGGENWQDIRDKAVPNKKLKIIHLGNISATASRSGINFLAKKVLPELDIILPGKYELHICGKGALEPEISSLLDRSHIFLRGFVEDLKKLLFETDVFFVPTPIPLGGRYRIPYAWSTGCSVVAHSANKFGLEVMRNGENSLLGSSGPELAHLIARLSSDQDLKRTIQRGGRETFEKYFAPQECARELINITEKEFLGFSDF